MLQAERREKILAELMQNGSILIEDLVRIYEVSAMTIRRDLDALEKAGKLIRSHGGAVIPDSVSAETPYRMKESENSIEKQRIADTAAKLIPQHAKIILDSGTTTYEIAKRIKHRSDLTIITNDVHISLELLESPSLIISTGGNMEQNTGAYLGPHVETMLSSIHVDMLFLGAHALHPRSGITAPTIEKARIKKLMLQAARTTWIVADTSKFNKQAFADVCPLKRADGLITNALVEQMANLEDYKEQVQITLV